MNKLASYLMVIVVLLGAGLWWSVQQSGAVRVERDAAVAAAKGTIRSLERAESAVVSARAEKAAIARQSLAATEALNRALQGRKDWGDTETPPEVQEALRGAVEGLE